MSLHALSFRMSYVLKSCIYSSHMRMHDHFVWNPSQKLVLTKLLLLQCRCWETTPTEWGLMENDICYIQLSQCDVLSNGLSAVYWQEQIRSYRYSQWFVYTTQTGCSQDMIDLRLPVHSTLSLVALCGIVLRRRTCWVGTLTTSFSCVHFDLHRMFDQWCSAGYSDKLKSKWNSEACTVWLPTCPWREEPLLMFFNEKCKLVAKQFKRKQDMAHFSFQDPAETNHRTHNAMARWSVIPCFSCEIDIAHFQQH